jgi:hypothetical protein
LWNYDFDESEFEQVPLGARLDKDISIGIQPVNAILQSWYNAANSGEITRWNSISVFFSRWTNAAFPHRLTAWRRT